MFSYVWGVIMKRSKLYFRWFLSYAVIVGIALIFSSGIYNLYTNTMEDEIKKLNQSFLTQMKTVMDGEIQTLDNTCNIIGLTPQIQKVINMGTDLNSDDRYVIQEALKKMRLYNVSNLLIRSMYIYSFKSNTILTNETVYYDKYLHLCTEDNFGMELEEFKRIMKRNYQRQLVSSNNIANISNGMEKMLYIQSLPVHLKSSMDAALVFIIDAKKIEKLFAEDAFSQDSYFSIIDKQNRIFYHKGNASLGLDLTYDVLIGDESIHKKIEGQPVVITYMDSDVSDFKYVRVLPESLFYKEAKYLKNITLGILFILAFLGLILSFYFARHNYKPLKRIVLNLPQDGSEDSMNEFDLLEVTLETSYKERRKLHNQLENQNKLLRNNFLVKLLKGRFTREEEIIEHCKAYDVEFPYRKFFIVLFKINDLSDFNKTDNKEAEYQLATFIISNVFKEVMSKYYECTMVQIDDSLGAILNYNMAKEDYYLGYITETLEETYSFIEENYHIDFTIALSNGKSLLGLSEAYREALDALTYTRILGPIDIIFYSETLERKHTYDFSNENEQRLINLIKLGDFNNVKDYIDNIIQQQLKNKISIETTQVLLFDLLSTVKKTIQNAGEEKLMEELHIMPRMLKSPSIENMRCVLEELIRELCKLKRLKLNQQNEMSMSQMALTFIMDNYQNPDLNVSMLGEQFDITPAYLSKLYKQETGGTLLSTINKVRIEASKKLLCNTSMTVGQIALEVGYSYSNAFIRVFKKYEGVTPGQYKAVTQGIV